MSEETAVRLSRPAEVESLVDTLVRREELEDIPHFRVASYNMRNLFGEEEDINTGRPGAPATAEQLDALAKMVLDLNADVIGFQEVQNKQVLTRLFRERVNPKLKSRRLRPFSTFVCVPARDPRGINVAVATRFSLRATLSFQDREFGPTEERAKRFSRDLLGAEIYATPSYRFLFFVAHLKSKMGGDASTYKRELEAKEIRSILEEPVFGGTPYIQQDTLLVGDMNDDPDTGVIGILRGDGATKARDVLEELNDYSYPVHNRYKKTRLDYIFASPSISKRVRNPAIHNVNPLAAQASDHYPVSAEISVA